MQQNNVALNHKMDKCLCLFTGKNDGSNCKRPVLKRQNTLTVENVRRDEEKEALDLWHNIVTFCKVVSICSVE